MLLKPKMSRSAPPVSVSLKDPPTNVSFPFPENFDGLSPNAFKGVVAGPKMNFASPSSLVRDRIREVGAEGKDYRRSFLRSPGCR